MNMTCVFNMRPLSCVSKGLLLFGSFCLPFSALAVEVEDVSKDSPQLQLKKMRMQNGELQLQIEQLRNQIMKMRGDMETVQFKMESLEKKLEANLKSQEETPVDVAIATDPEQNTPGSDLMTYESAFNLLKQKKYSDADAAFKDYVKKYPKGVYQPNANYWLGELALLDNKTGDAKSAFQKVIQISPGHRKAADARFKLAQIYQRTGDDEKSKALLKTIMDTSTKDSRVRGLATSFWEQHYAQ